MHQMALSLEMSRRRQRARRQHALVAKTRFQRLGNNSNTRPGMQEQSISQVAPQTCGRRSLMRWQDVYLINIVATLQDNQRGSASMRLHVRTNLAKVKC